MSDRYKNLYKRKVRAYQWLYDFTAQCDQCAVSGCACKDSICAHVQEQNKKAGVELKTGQNRLRFIGESGCMVPPHLRETCTFYLCDYAQKKTGFDSKLYERLKNLCQKIDWKLMVLEESSTSSSSSNLK